MRHHIFVAIFLVLLGCEKDPVGTASTNNPNIAVSFLFEHDGVKVYRFYDNGVPIYFTDARGKTQWKQRHGKTSYSVGVETVGDAN